MVADYGTGDPDIAQLLKRLQGSEQLPFLAIFPAGEPEKVIRFQTYKAGQLIEALEKAGPSKTSTESDPPAKATVAHQQQTEPVIMTSRLP